MENTLKGTQAVAQRICNAYDSWADDCAEQFGLTREESLSALTDAGRAWVDENLQLEGWQWMGDAFACEPAYVDALACGMTEDGLIVD